MNAHNETKRRDTTQASKIRWIKAAVILFYLALIAGLALYDETPNPEMLKVLSSPLAEVFEPGNGWVAAIGFAAPEGVSPYTWGEEKIRNLENMVHAGKDSKEILARINEDKSELSFKGKGEILGWEFWSYSNKIIPYAATHADYIAALVRENKELLQRYDSLRAYPHYTESLDYVFYSDLPYGIELTHKLKIIQQAVLASHGDIDGPLKDLRKDIEFWRLVARNSKLILPKLTSIIQLQIDLRFAAELASYRHLNAKEMELVRSILRPMGSGEITISRQYLGDFRCFQKGDNLKLSRRKKLFGVIGSPLFKRYATANRKYAYLLKLIHLDGLPPEKLVAEEEQMLARWKAGKRYRIGLRFLYNPAGELNAVWEENHDYIGYTVGAHDLEEYRRLALLKVLIHQENVPPDRIQQFLDYHQRDLGDIYTDGPMKWDPKKGRVFSESGHGEIFL